MYIYVCVRVCVCLNICVCIYIYYVNPAPLNPTGPCHRDWLHGARARSSAQKLKVYQPCDCGAAPPPCPPVPVPVVFYYII